MNTKLSQLIEEAREKFYKLFHVHPGFNQKQFDFIDDTFTQAFHAGEAAEGQRIIKHIKTTVNPYMVPATMERLITELGAARQGDKDNESL